MNLGINLAKHRVVLNPDKHDCSHRSPEQVKENIAAINHLVYSMADALETLREVEEEINGRMIGSSEI